MLDIADHYSPIAVAQPVLDDLAHRLEQVRWPLAPAGASWQHGTSLGFMRELVDYWREGFDWRAVEMRLNRFRHYRLPAGDRRIHAIVEPGSGSSRPPLLLLHGWPGSVIEFLPLIEPLAHPARFGGRAEDGVTVIAASLPGYAFSDPPDGPIGPREAGVWLRAMMTQTLGFARFAVHGGDWGAAIASWMAHDAPAQVASIHLTSAILQPDVANAEPPLDDAELAHIEARRIRGPWESGYQAIQGTKPLTLAYGLADSPVGLAAWVIEKYHGWSVARGTDRAPPMDRDDLLTVAMLYWLAEPGPASWMYRFLVDGTAFRLPKGHRVEVPTSLCLFGDDISPIAPLRWQQRSYNVVSRTLIPHGSHFPGLDAAPALLEDLKKFVAAL